MSDKRVFKIGQLVEVNLNNQTTAYYDTKSYRRIERMVERLGRQFEQNDLILARITGVKIFQEGQYFPAYNSSSFMEAPENEQAYVSLDKTITTWAIRLGYKNKELYYFAEDIVALSFNHVGLDIPYFWTGGWSKEMKAKMSRESKDWPRDERGRWSKG